MVICSCLGGSCDGGASGTGAAVWDAADDDDEVGGVGIGDAGGGGDVGDAGDVGDVDDDGGSGRANTVCRLKMVASAEDPSQSNVSSSPMLKPPAGV